MSYFHFFYSVLGLYTSYTSLIVTFSIKMIYLELIRCSGEGVSPGLTLASIGMRCKMHPSVKLVLEGFNMNDRGNAL